MRASGPVRPSTLREVIRLIRQDASGFVRIRLAGALVLILIASVLTGLGPVALQRLVDGFTGRTIGPGYAVALIAAYVLSQWLARIIGEIRGLLYARAERRMARSLSERLFAHVLHLPLRFHLNRRTGALTQILDNGLQGYERVVYTLVFTILPVLAELGTILVVLARIHQPVFLGFFAAALVIYAFAFTFAARAIMAAAGGASQAQVDATSAMTDSILNYETIKFCTAEKAVQASVRHALIETEEQWVTFYRRYAFSGLGVGTVTYATREVQAGVLTVGTFVLLNTYMLQIVRPVEQLGYALQSLSQGVAYLEKLIELFREEPEPRAAEGSASHDGPGELVFEDVSVGYRAERCVLSQVDFTLKAGQTLGIVGGSGAGKSTLVRLLVRMIEPDAGRLLLDGVPISELPLSVLRQAVAVVPQDTVLFNDSIGYNIAFGRPGCTQGEVEQAARLAHLHDFILSLPEGYDTLVGERGMKLSGGEKQRLSIARATIKRPRIYVFDEATSSLDSHTEKEIQRNLREISRFSTTLIIAHRLSTVVDADEIIVLEGGTIVERGTHLGLLRQQRRYASLWEAQQQGSAA
jgi:ABC-type multidrug transport system fused ATPase/permease subunit